MANESEVEIARTLVRVTVCVNLILEHLGITNDEIEEAFKKANLGNFAEVGNRSKDSRTDGSDSGEQQSRVLEVSSKGADLGINGSGIENGGGPESPDDGGNSFGSGSDSD